MGKFVSRTWRSRLGSEGLTRRQVQAGSYQAYVPDLLAGQTFTFEASTAADIADAERNVTRLDTQAMTLANTEALARILLRAEAVASSRIEGLLVSTQRLLRADIARAEGETISDATAVEVLANVDAMAHAIDGPEQEVTVERMLEVHRFLLAPTRLAQHAGHIRTQQNWIGGSGYNPFAATFVPPPPEGVPALLDDLCAFCNDDALPTIAQAAIAHAQFETIHPFVDGNGRTGRALVHMILKRRGLATRTLLPVSLILATRARDYVAALQALHFEGAPNSPPAQKAMNDWVGLFAGACSRAVLDAESFERRVEELRLEWRSRLGPIRSDAAALALLEQLPATPIVTVRSVEQVLGVSFSTANVAIELLTSAGILTQTRAGKRNRAFEARELIHAFTGLERQMASIDGDTMMSEPAREVPPMPARKRGK